MATIVQGGCIYCGQIRQVEVDTVLSDEQVNKEATLKCDCIKSRSYQRKNRMEQKISENVETKAPEVAELLRAAVAPYVGGMISKIVVEDSKGYKYTIKESAKDTVLLIEKKLKTQQTI